MIRLHGVWHRLTILLRLDPIRKRLFKQFQVSRELAYASSPDSDYLVCVLSGLCKTLGGFSDKVMKHALQIGHVLCLFKYHFAKQRE